MLRNEETDEDVDFLPFKPALLRRYTEDLGVSGAGDSEGRLLCERLPFEPYEEAVLTRGRVGYVFRN